ncbi:R3H domain, partial [Rhizoctonia solani]
MASVWAGYRCSLLGFVLFATTFTLIISAQNIETGRLVDGGNTKRATVGFASISSNKPAPNTCHGGPKSAWDICAASQGMLALLALTTIALIGHTGMMVVMTIKLSRRTEESVWRVMAWELDDKLRPRPERVITTTNVPMSGVEAGVIQERPVSKVLPPVPMGMVEDPPRARNPLTFSTVSSLLNPAPRDLPGSARQEGRFQLHDGPAPVPVERPPVQRAFERISGYIHDDPHNAPNGFGGFSMYYAPTPVYDRFARGMSEAFPSSGVGTPVTPALKPPSPLQPRKIQKKDGRWMLADESDALERPLVGEDRPTLPARFQSRMHEIQPPAAAQVTPVRRPSRTPPRIMPATRGVMSNANQMPDLSQLRLHDASPAGRFEQHANTFDGGRGASGGFHYGSTSPTQNLAPGLAQNATIATSPLKQGKPSRAGLPSAWLEQSVAHDDRSFSPPQTSDLSSGGTSPPHNTLQPPQSMPMSASMGGIASPIDDEIIPTAIVIKNIPFTVKRETLLDIIASLSIPTPYAFNYHLDTQGQFRGLAFANFRLPQDADAVVAALNGFDVQGRKLRVEYKKVLQAGEKERIEREKAIRRMRSMQMEKERTQLLNPPSASANEWDDYGTQQGPGSNAYLSPSRSYSSGQAQLAHQLPPMHSPPPPPPQHVPTPTPSQQSTKSASNELDMNDPSTLEIYSRILVFKEDHMRDELAFSRTLTPKQRRVVHLVAQKLGVYHYSVGEGENRYAVVTRIEREVRSPIQRHASQTLSRAATSYLAPSPAAPSLRVKKSMPDMKSLHTPPTSRLQPRASNGNIREGFATISAASPRRPSVQTAFGGVFGSALPSAGDRSYGGVGVGIPPVPSLDSPGGAPSGVVRQPRGPGMGGFTRRATGERLEARTHEPLEMAMNDGDGIPGDGPVGIRPSMGRQLSGGVGLLSQPKSKPGPSPLSAASLAPDTTSRTATSTSTTPNATSAAQMATTPTATTTPTPSISSATPSFPRPSAATSSLSAPIPSNSQPNHSLLFSSGPEIVEELLDVPSPAPHIARSSPPPPSEPQPVASLEVRHEREPIVSPRTPPNLRLEIPPQDAPGPARDTTRAPFAPDPENEGICTEVGSLGQEIQLESGDHLNALERIYLYTQSKASFHRIFMSRALPTYLKEVTPTEAVEYVLPLLGGLAIDEEERVKEAFVGELLVIIWWFFTTCRVTDQEPEPAPENAEPDPDVIPLVSVQSFSAVLASLLLSSNSEVSATARGTVIELLGRTRWVVAGKDLDQEQTTQFCETMRPVGPWSRGRLGIEEARMIQLEMIYGVIIDLGRLDLNAEVVEDQAAQDALYSLENNEHEDLSTLVPPADDDSCLDPLVTPTPETSKSYANPMIYSDDEASVSGSETVSSFNQTLESSGTSIELPRSAPASVTTFNHTRALAPASKSAPGIGGNTSSSSSLNLPELSPADSSRSSVASPAEPVSPPENDEPRELSKSSNLSHSESMSLALPRSKISLSLPGSDTDTDNDDMLWHTPRGGEGFESGYFGSSNVTRESSPIATSSRLGVTRPGLERHSSSVSLVSEINPDEYVDAEWVDGEHSLENGAVGGGGEDEIVVNGVEEGESDPGVGVGTVTNSASAGVTENGTAEGQGGEGWTEDAYIDDGAAAEEAAIGRVASMSLVAAVASSGVVDDEIYTLFIEEVLRISSDPVYWVRSETSYALGTLAKTVTRESVESCLLPILESLVNDTESHVRQSSVYAIPSVLKRLDPQYRRELAIKYMLKLCNDDIEVVRTGSLQVLAEVIHTFHEDKSGPPDELIDFFLQGEKDLARAPLPKNEAERATPSAEKDPYSHWGAEPSSYFEADPSFPDPDRALICAFNYPAVVLTLGPKRWSRLSGYYTYLAEESWHTPKVRATLAASVGEIARIVGTEAARKDVIPVWWICLSSDQREAKLKALTALPLLLESLDGPGRSEVASKLGEAWEKHVSDWKVRDTFARQLSAVVPMLNHEGAVLCRIFKGGLEDRVAAIREAVIDALPVLYQVLQGNHALLKVARDDLFALGASGMSRHKTNFLASCRALVQGGQGDSILKDSRFGPNIVPLAQHSVIDVRIGLGRLMTAICENHMHTWKERPRWIIDCLEKLSLDSSADVRAFVHRVTSSEYVEPKSVESARPRPGTSTPSFAEFSRPP